MIALIVIVAVVVVFWVVLYNTMVGKKNQVNNVFASVDTLLKKRYDLIPNLVSTVQQYMEHERGTLTDITELRAKAMSGNVSENERVNLENKMSKLLGGIMVAVENYPQLKANENFMQLQRSMNEIEEQISAARRSYNAAVTDYNNAVEMVPTNVMASIMGYKLRELFEIPEAQRENVNVKELFKKD
ncbi:MAG: LemA family protein [Candidatus Omnitrophica bacterium]|nr:LemA family protein [Candidatus Omnitrophota bacterium]